MKIIQINASYKPAYIYGGPTMSVSKLSEELVNAGIDLTVFTTTANGATELQIENNSTQVVDGVNVRYFERLTKDHTHFSPALLWALRKEIKKQKAESKKSKELESGKLKVESPTQHSVQTSNSTHHSPIIHIHAWWNLVSMLSAFIAWFYGAPIVLSPRGMLTAYSLDNRNSLQKSVLHWLIGKRLLAYSHIHATSEKEAQDVQKTCKVKSISIIPNFVRFPLILPERHKTEENSYKLLFLSRIEEKKGLELLFDALAQVKFDWQLQLAGDGAPDYVQRLKSKAESLGFSQKIKWLGQVNDEQKFELFAANELLILTSYNENFANVVIESLSVGTPVLLSDQVGLATYVNENKLGWITALGIKNIADTLQQSFDQKEKRDDIIKIAPSIIRKDFTTAQLVKKYIALYQNLN